MSGRIDAGRLSELELDCFRTNNDNDWWTVIMMLMGTAPLLVVDGTAKTPGLVRERDYLLEAGFT